MVIDEATTNEYGIIKGTVYEYRVVNLKNIFS